MIGTDVTDHSRRLLNDEREGLYRWPQDTLIMYLNQAIERLYSVRPDLKLQSDDSIDTDDALTTGAETLLMPNKFLEPLALSVTACALREDGIDSANIAVAQGYDEMFMLKVKV